MQIIRSLGGYSHRERWRAPEKTFSLQGNRRHSHYKGVEDILITRESKTFSLQRSRRRSHYKGVEDVLITRESKTFSLQRSRRFSHYKEVKTTVCRYRRTCGTAKTSY